MALNEKKITDAILQTGVISAPDKLTGTASENKAVFDRLIRNIVAQSINPIIDELSGASGAATIGAAIQGLTGASVQELLATLKTLTDDQKKTLELLQQETGLLLKNVELDREGVWTFTTGNGNKIPIDSKLGSLALFQELALKAEQAAKRAQEQADRATDIAGGNLATRTELETKTDKLIPLKAGSLAVLDALGNVADSRTFISDYATLKNLEDRTPLSTAIRISLPLIGWVGVAAPYTQTVSVPKLIKDPIIIFGVDDKENEDIKRSFISARITARGLEQGILTVRAEQSKPLIDLFATVVTIE